MTKLESANALILPRLRARAGFLLRLEQAWPTLLPALAALLGFALAAELALPQSLPDWLQVCVLLALLVLVCNRLWVCAEPWRASRADAMAAPMLAGTIDRRIEQRSGLPHRPLQTLTDRPAGQAGTVELALWTAHQERTATGLGGLCTGWPRLDLWPYQAGKLVLFLVPALLVSGILAGPASWQRLASGFLPGLFELPGPAPWMQAWITPPDYARTAPVFLTDPNGTVTVPYGSVLQVTLTGMKAPPRLRLHPAAATGAHFARLSQNSWNLTRILETSTGVTVRGNGRSLAGWHIQVTPLPAALLAWNGAPGAATDRSGEPWRTRLPWRFSNPFGLDRLGAEIQLADPGRAPPAPLEIPIGVTPDTREAHGTALPDLSADPRAGEAVIARLVGTDAKGHALSGPPARFTLPARSFRNPLARAVLDTRKRLALGRENRADAAADLEALGEAPGQFATDTGLFLNLQSIASLLRDEDQTNRAAADEATGRLWELALGLEDGLHNDRQGARAVADLRAARDAVNAQLDRMRALGDKGQNEAEQSELERRIQALSQAIGRRMQALAEQARREHTLLPPMPDSKMLSGQDLARMMQQMRDDAAHGKAADAMQQLAQMQSMLDRMRAATPQDLEQAEQQQAAQAQLHEQMQGLQDLVRREAGMLDQTQARRNQQARQDHTDTPPGMDPQTAELLQRLGISPNGVTEDPSPGQLGGPDTPPQLQHQANPDPQTGDHQAADRARTAQQQDAARVQHSLARALDELATEFKVLTGQQPSGFDDARHAMQDARQALSNHHDDAAQDAQQKALAALQKGASQMQQAQREQSSGGGSATTMLMPSLSEGSSGGSPGDGDDEDDAGQQDKSGPRDPLGRPVATGSHGGDGDTHVPDKAEQMRAQEIEQELRRRDTDRTRSQDELDYLGRLLKPF